MMASNSVSSPLPEVPAASGRRVPGAVAAAASRTHLRVASSLEGSMAANAGSGAAWGAPERRGANSDQSSDVVSQLLPPLLLYIENLDFGEGMGPG